MFLEPAIQPDMPPLGFDGQPPSSVNFTVHRQDVWRNRKEAHKILPAMCHRWDPRCIERMARHNFRPLPTLLHPTLPAGADPNNPPVTLTLSKHHQVAAQMRENFEAWQSEGRIQPSRLDHPNIDPALATSPLYAPETKSAYDGLSKLRPSLFVVLGGDSKASLDKIREGVCIAGTGVGGSGGITEGRAKHVTIPGHAHLMPLTAMNQAVDLCAEWLGSEMEIYKTQEVAWKDKQASLRSRDHYMLDESWFEHVKPFSAFKRKPKRNTINKSTSKL